MKCKGKNRQGSPCGKNAMVGRDYCRTHGGTKPIGPANHAYKHGRRGKYIPARLAEKYKEAMADPTLMEFRADASLLESRLCELLTTGESMPLWASTQEEFQEMRKAMAEHDGVNTAYHLSRLESLISRGMADALRWAEVYRVTEQIGKTKEREHKREAVLRQTMTVEEVLALIGQLGQIIRDNVSNAEEVNAVHRQIARFGVVEVGGSDSAAGH